VNTFPNSFEIECDKDIELVNVLPIIFEIVFDKAIEEDSILLTDFLKPVDILNVAIKISSVPLNKDDMVTNVATIIFDKDLEVTADILNVLDSSFRYVLLNKPDKDIELFNSLLSDLEVLDARLSVAVRSIDKIPGEPVLAIGSVDMGDVPNIDYSL
jgi:hypothetical protein